MTKRDATAVGGVFLSGFYLGYQLAKWANGVDLDLGMLDLAFVIGLAVSLGSWASSAGSPGKRE